MYSLIKKLSFPLLGGLLLLSLENCYLDTPEKKEWGFKPVYSNELEDIIALEPPRPLKHLGKIYSYEQYLLINEPQQGLHVIDNSDPRNPKQLSFLKLLGSNDIAIKNNIIYADQFRNMMIVKMEDVSSILDKRLVSNTFQNHTSYDVSPPGQDLYYECPNPSLGVVVNWTADSVDYPCYK